MPSTSQQMFDGPTVKNQNLYDRVINKNPRVKCHQNSPHISRKWRENRNLAIIQQERRAFLPTYLNVKNIPNGRRVEAMKCNLPNDEGGTGIRVEAR